MIQRTLCHRWTAHSQCRCSLGCLPQVGWAHCALCVDKVGKLSDVMAPSPAAERHDGIHFIRRDTAIRILYPDRLLGRKNGNGDSMQLIARSSAAEVNQNRTGVSPSYTLSKPATTTYY